MYIYIYTYIYIYMYIYIYSLLAIPYWLFPTAKTAYFTRTNTHFTRKFDTTDSNNGLFDINFKYAILYIKYSLLYVTYVILYHT